MITFSREVQVAKEKKAPIVALESTIIAHGLPRPRNLEVAIEVETLVRDSGATPATIAIIEGVIHVGLESFELDRVANDSDVVKASIRDLPFATVNKLTAATTVAATSHIANLSGIEFFATGGLGGVHRGDELDESADLLALATIPVLVVCAGVKSILDVPATLERLETLSVPLLGYKTKTFPGFYLADSGQNLEHSADSPNTVAKIWQAKKAMGLSKKGMVVANPTKTPMAKDLHDKLLNEGLRAAYEKRVTGKDVTPFLLEYFHSHSAGESLRVNEEIIRSNAVLAAQIAVANG
jgi:pseudouridine-5'-phosphate glycosidase